MTDMSPRFGGLVVASLAGVVGVKYLLGGALAAVDATSVSALLVMGSVPLTLVAGTLLGLTAGAILAGSVMARSLTVAMFLGIIGLSVPAIRATDPVILTESLGMGLSIVYLALRKPVVRVKSATVDETDSATRHGSTLR